ncbi:helix-turn-helix transcriptional regulator [Pikeienuella sp. HZG-20]|uniref:helix-turn-helix transcriptional regulator n=1 Tax=Paludibacillus litoralis TaxID=3133267 RepID=UPI0030EBF634
MTGAELAALRKAARLSQSALAQRAGIGRHSVSYWECKAQIDPRAWAVERMGEVLTLPDIRPVKHARATWAETIAAEEARAFAAIEARFRARLADERALRRVRCGARTRKGTPCSAKSIPGKRRCKFHGGLSTGARTSEGRQRIAEAQRRRWARRRAERTYED